MKREKLKAFLNNYDYSQKDLAFILNETESTISRIISGKIAGSAIFWLKFAAKFNLTVDDIKYLYED